MWTALMFHLAIFLDAREMACLIVGGGSVGRRKALAILASGGRATIVDRLPRPADLPHDVAWRQQEYDDSILDGFQLVFAAATMEANDRVVRGCRRLGLWVNSATAPDAGDFILPAVRRKGRIECAVATGGSSPILSGRIADRLVEIVDDAYVEWVDILAELRTEIHDRVHADKRAQLFQTLCDPSWPERIRADGRQTVARSLHALVAAAATS